MATEGFGDGGGARPEAGRRPLIVSAFWDAIVVGAGHNGLVAAAYLAKAGRRVLVLERRGVPGGLAVTEEFAPGFRASVGPDLVGLLLPRVLADLSLSRHGLDVLPLDPVVTTLTAPGADGPHLTLWRDEARSLESIARRSPADADRYGDFAALVQRMARFLRPLMSAPPTSPDIDGGGDLLELLKLGLSLRRIGGDAMHETLRVTPMAISDFLHEWFEDDVLKATLAAQGLHGVALGPRSAGSAAMFLYHQLGEPAWPRVSWGLARGGAGGVGMALARAAESAGATIRVDASVARILVDIGADGGVAAPRATGVALESGEEIAAGCVVSNASPRATLLELLPPGALEPEFVREVLGIRYRGVTARVHLALDRPPAFVGLSEPHLRGVIQIGSSLDYLERAYDAVKYGRCSEHPMMEIVVPSLSDPALAPAGRHVMSVSAQFVPYHLRDGDWETRADALGDRIIDTLETYWPDIRSAVRYRQVITPLALETAYGLPEGSLHHGEMALDQLVFMRPVPGWARYRMPIDRLYLCGAGTHPGGGLSGACGYNAANAVLG